MIDSVALCRGPGCGSRCTYPGHRVVGAGPLAAQTHHQVGHIALDIGDERRRQIQQDLQEQQQRGVRVIVVVMR
ncbi:hypothetical protein MJ699_12170 [Klebsiella pneumoniae]|nr:hypothetical protein MJ699_12170 [Klebsiella pneumoniae]